MLKVFRKLTKSASLPPTDDQIRKHRENMKELEQWQTDVEALRVIIGTMKQEYDHQKGDFALGRYEGLKDMIKSAVKQFHDTLNEISRRNVDSTAPSRFSSINNLRQNAAAFARHQETVRTEERYYAGMSGQKLNEEIRDLRTKILELKAEFRLLKENLEKLSDDYGESKKLNPSLRYKAMKDMIKNVVAASSITNLP